MNEKDSLVRCIACNGEISLIAVSAKNIVDTAVTSHDLSPTPAAALGRTMIASIMMSEELKNEGDSLTVTINGGGPVGHIVAYCDKNACVKGYVDNPHAEAPLHENGKLNVSGIVGTDGTVRVVRSNGEDIPYTGVSKLVSGEIAEDITSYYFESEQKTTAVALGVQLEPSGKCLSAGGVLIHVLPNASEESIERAEQAVSKLSAVSSSLKTLSPLEILQSLFEDVKLLKEVTPIFKCNCSHDTIKKVVVAIGREDAKKLIEERGEIEIICTYCGKKYKFKSYEE